MYFWSLSLRYLFGFHSDQSTGEITGPDPDLIKSVCEIAKKKCEVLFLSESQADHVCVASDEQTGNNIFGTGLQGGLFDACVGWGNSLSRKTFFDFTTPQIRSVSGVLFVRKADAAGFDPAGKTIIVVAHEVFDAFCYKQISGVTNVKFIVAESKAAAVEKLIALEGDAIFTSVIGPQAVHPSIEKLSTPFKCSEGFAMIVKRGSSLPCWWDRAFQEYKTSGRYKTEYCAAVADKLGQLVGAPVTEEFVCFLDDI